MSRLFFVPYSEFGRLERSSLLPAKRAQLFAELCRVNALYMITNAGSGHIGTSFSSLDILSWLYLFELRLLKTPEGLLRRTHDIFFSSKGHDAPALYAVLVATGRLGEKCLHTLRRLGGLPGHPDVETPFIEANSGSLGMGLSKAKGMALANRLRKKRRKIFVLAGDGEWQEGQMWEALFSASRDRLHEITVIVDHNQLQSDTWVEKVNGLGPLEKKFESFGWRVFRCDGHDFGDLSRVFRRCRKETRKPQVVIADTLKGKGVSFMQSDAMKPGDRLYRFHSGAPGAEVYDKAFKELKRRIDALSQKAGLETIHFESREFPPRRVLKNPERLIESYAKTLSAWGRRRHDLIALDADLALDCGLLLFEKEFPGRFLECGIAEQDMVSQAGGLARQGFLPVVHSFASFLSSRANEQIFSNATEKTKIIYVATLAGLLPAAPGHSHQAVRDIASLSAVPGLVLIQPAWAAELEAAFSWAVKDHSRSTYLRLSSVPWEAPFGLPGHYAFQKGRGTVVREGKDGLIFAYGPVLLSQAFEAAVFLKEKQGLELGVVNLPWLNQVDVTWLKEVAGRFPQIFTVDDHAILGGQGQMLAAEIARWDEPVRVHSFGVEGIPLCGAHEEVLKAHGLDARSLAQRIARQLDRTLLTCR